MSWLYFLKSKDEAATAIEHFVNMVECQFSATILSFQTDNGGECHGGSINYIADTPTIK